MILMTAPASTWAARRIPVLRAACGALIGLLVALEGPLLSFKVSPRAIVAFALTVGAGWLGGILTGRAVTIAGASTPRSRAGLTPADGGGGP